MTALLTRLIGRLPIGWLQLVHNRTRFAAALAGVAFANILIFMQLGFLGALIASIKLPYDQMNADVLISASDMNTLIALGTSAAYLYSVAARIVLFCVEEENHDRSLAFRIVKNEDLLRLHIVWPVGVLHLALHLFHPLAADAFKRHHSCERHTASLSWGSARA